MNAKGYLTVLQDKIWPVVNTKENIEYFIFTQVGALPTYCYCCWGMNVFLENGWDDVVHMIGWLEALIYQHATFFEVG